MAILKLAGGEREIRPFKLADVRKAAPLIDQIMGRYREGGATVQVMMENAGDMLEVLVIGMDGVTAEQLEAELGVDDLPAVRAAYQDVMAEAGFKPPGEAKGEAEDRTAPRKKGSTTSSQSSSPPAAETGTD